jgi:hypothetical protein
VSRTLAVRDRVAAAIVAALDGDAGVAALRDLARTGSWPVDEVAAILRRIEIGVGVASAYHASGGTAEEAPLARALRKSARLFAAGLFFEVHEVLEEAWHGLDEPERSAVQGLIQIAVGLHHLAHGNASGAASLFAAGRGKLAPHRPTGLGVDVATLLDGLPPWEAAAAAGAWPDGAILPPFQVADQVRSSSSTM